MRAAAALLALAALAGAAPASAAPRYAEPTPVDGGQVVKVKLDFNIAKAAPDCFLRNVYTVNGKFGIHTIQAHRGDVLDIEVINNIPADYPDVHDGITLHWHGLTMPGSDYWYDGTAYVTQCPLVSGKTQRYKFLLVDGPGLFWWHSHVGLQAMDGIFGPLVILPSRTANATAAAVPAADGGDLVMAVGDWWHSTGPAIAFPLGRPFDVAKQTPATGPYYWSDVPQAIHINGRALWMDCALEPYLGNASIPCKPDRVWVGPGRAAGNVGATPNNPGCARTNFTVQAGKTYRWRVINVGALMDLNVCVQGHNLTIVAADGIPVEPMAVGSCFTINLGQRMDVLMKADQAAGGAFWVVAQANYRPSSPNGYAVLKYEGFNGSLPTTPAPSGQPTAPWGPAQIAALKMPDWLAGRADPPPGVVPEQVAHLMPGEKNLKLPERSTRFVFINNTQPILPTGQVRWALNQVVMSETPKCDAFAEHVQRSGTAFIEKDFADTVREGEGADVGVSLGVQEVNRTETPVYVYGRNGSQPVTPVVGKQVILLDVGDVVDVVIQNLPPGANNGAVKRPANAPTVQEPHPFHVHGVHFWLLGTGLGAWNESLLQTDINWWNPPMRDTAMLPPYGWVMFRFVAAYPGVWMMHCHALLHLYMGQALLFVVSPDKMPAPPPTLPACKKTCSAAMAPWDQAYVAKKWPNTPYDVGPLTEISESLGATPVQGVTEGKGIYEAGAVPANGAAQDPLAPAAAPKDGAGDPRG